jgi:hypothetical protein
MMKTFIQACSRLLAGSALISGFLLPLDAMAARGMWGSACQPTGHTKFVVNIQGFANISPTASNTLVCPLGFAPGKAAKTVYLDYTSPGRSVTCSLRTVAADGAQAWSQSFTAAPNGHSFMKFTPPSAFEGYGVITCLLPPDPTNGANPPAIQGYNTSWDW